jgi:hypothetical protein
MDEKAHDIPADVYAEEGDVNVVGPGGIRYAFTPEAAAETSDRLLDGAATAHGQRLKGKPRDPKPD